MEHTLHDHYRENTLRRDLQRIGKYIVEYQMIFGYLGTESVVFDREKKLYIVKPGPVRYRTAEPDDFAVITEDGTPLSQKHERPSENWLVHRAIYDVRDDIGAIIHAHPIHTQILTSQSNPVFKDVFPDHCVDQGLDILTALPVTAEENGWLEKPTEYNPNATVPIVKDLPPHKLAKAAQNAILKANVFLIRNHGIMAVGRDLDEAFDIALGIEIQARVICGIISGSPGIPLWRSGPEVHRELKSMPQHFSRPYTVPSLKFIG